MLLSTRARVATSRLPLPLGPQRRQLGCHVFFDFFGRIPARVAAYATENVPEPLLPIRI